MRLLCHLKSFGSVLQSFFREFMSGQMVAFSVMIHCRGVRVFREIVKFSCSLMRIVHDD